MKTKENMIAVGRKAVFALALSHLPVLCSFASDWHSGYLEVPAGDSVLLTTPATENSLNTDADGTVVKVDGELEVRFAADVSVSDANAWRVNVRNSSGALTTKTAHMDLGLGNEVGLATLTLDHVYLDTFVHPSNCGSLRFGAKGRFVMKNKAHARIGTVRAPASPAVPGESGEFDAIEIGEKCTFRVDKLWNDQNYPLVIRFTGTESVLRNGYKESEMFWCPMKGFALEGVNGTPITLMTGENKFIIFNPNSWYSQGKVQTRGNCDVRFFSGYASAEHDECVFQLTQKMFDWQNSGDLRVCVSETQSYRLCALQVTAADALPYGPQTGIVRIENGTSCRLEVNASQKLNGLWLSEGSTIKNATATPVTLTFGTGDTDGVLNANTRFDTAGAINLAKAGTGTLTVSNTPAIPSLDIQGGVVRFKETDCAVSVLTAVSGAKVIADGCTVTCPLVLGVTFEEVNGGHVIAIVNTDTAAVADWSEATPAFSKLEKNGPGTYTYMSGTAFAGDVHVKGGRLIFTAVGTTNEWLKFVFKDMWNGYPFELSEIKLVDAAGEMLAGTSYSDAAADCAVKDLARKSIWASDQTWLRKDLTGYYERNPSALLDGASYTRLVYNTGNTAKLNDPTTWKTFIIRLPETVTALSRFNFKNGYSSSRGGPEHWELWTSADGETWELSDDYACPAPKSGSGVLWKTDGHFAIRSGAGIPGGGGVVATANVRVDSGAVLDCFSVAGGQIISHVTCDMVAGGGTLCNVKFAASGVLTLVGVTKAQLKGGMTVPLTFEGVSGVENLSNWQVVVDGKVVSKSLTWSDGKLTLAASGFVLVFR